MATHFFISCIIILNAVDAVFTVAWVESGLAVEANPVMAMAIAVSPVFFVLTKLVLVNVSVLLLWHLKKHSAAQAGAALCAGVYYALLLFHVQHASGMAGYYLAG